MFRATLPGLYKTEVVGPLVVRDGLGVLRA